MSVQPIVYNDDWSQDALADIRKLDAIQVWVNPIADGKDRTILDSILREAALAETLVFTHPDTIMKLGTKRVLVDLKDTSIGSDSYEHPNVEGLRNGLVQRLPEGARVIKQVRGHSGGGIWLIAPTTQPGEVLLRHAQRGCPEERIPIDDALERMRPYFDLGHSMFEQPYQDRIGEGMIRVYLVGREVAGFGHQEAVALAPARRDGTLPDMGPRLYYPPDEQRFQPIRNQTESRWIEEIQRTLGLTDSDLPLLWDIDLMYGPKDNEGNDTYVLCEINVSCVTPYPAWANPLIARQLRHRIAER
jgi:hypothetical protein